MIKGFKFTQQKNKELAKVKIFSNASRNIDMVYMIKILNKLVKNFFIVQESLKSYQKFKWTRNGGIIYLRENKNSKVAVNIAVHTASNLKDLQGI